MLTQIDLLKKYGIAIKGHVGQHLLIDPNIQRKIVDLLELQPEDRVLEIGPGLGALSSHILGRCHSLSVIEMDEKFTEILREELPLLEEKPNRLLHADVLKTDLKETLKPKKGERYKVVSNLPYYITAPILFHLFESRTFFSKYVLMMQKEVASRLTASPGSKDYGRLTLAVRYSGKVQGAFDVPKTCFTPQPAVSSSVVTIEPHAPEAFLPAKKEALLFHIIKTAFSQRRKMLFRLLADDSELGADKSSLRDIFEKGGINLSARGEQLLLKDYLFLTESLSKK